MTNKTSKLSKPAAANRPTTTAKPAVITKTSAALSLLTAAYAKRSSDARAALKAREGEVVARVGAVVVSIETTLGTPDDDDSVIVRGLLGDDRISAYTRAESASRALTSIAQAETIASVAVAATPARPATPPKAAKPATTASAPSPAEPGTVILKGVVAWNYYSLAKSAKLAAESAGWTPAKLAKFLAAIGRVRKHAEVLALVRKHGLKVVS